MRLSATFSLAASLALLFGPRASAAFSLNPGAFQDPEALVDNTVVGPILKSIALLTDHRAFEPATPLGTQLGLDIGIQLALVKLPTSFTAALTQAGGGAAMSNVPFVPLPLVNIHKGIGTWVDIGASGIIYEGQEILGFDAKVAFYQPEEGPTFAFRLNYGMSSFKFVDPGTQAALSISTQTLKPELLVSKKLDFADPYLGVGYQYTRGTLGISVPVPFIDQTVSLSANSQAPGGAIAFVGVALRIPNVGIAVTLDEEYSSAGADSLGMQFGFAF